MSQKRTEVRLQTRARPRAPVRPQGGGKAGFALGAGVLLLAGVAAYAWHRRSDEQQTRDLQTFQQNRRDREDFSRKFDPLERAIAAKAEEIQGVCANLLHGPWAEDTLELTKEIQAEKDLAAARARAAERKGAEVRAADGTFDADKAAEALTLAERTLTELTELYDRASAKCLNAVNCVNCDIIKQIRVLKGLTNERTSEINDIVKKFGYRFPDDGKLIVDYEFWWKNFCFLLNNPPEATIVAQNTWYKEYEKIYKEYTRYAMTINEYSLD